MEDPRYVDATTALATFQQTSEWVPALDDAIAGLRQLLAEQPDRDGAVLSQLGRALFNRFQAQGAAQDLTEAVGIYRDALAATADDHPELALRRTRLASALNAQAQKAGDRAGLAEAAQLAAVAVDTAPAHDLIFALRTQGQIACSMLPYAQDRQTADLAIAAAQRGLRTGTDDADERFWLHFILATGHGGVAQHTSDLADVEGSIAAFRDAVAVDVPWSNQMAMAHSGLGVQLASRAELLDRPAELAEAIGHLRQARTGLAADDPMRPHACVGLSWVLLSRFDHSHEMDDLDEAREVILDGLASSGPDFASAEIMHRLAGRILTLRARYRPSAETQRELDEYERTYQAGDETGQAMSTALAAMTSGTAHDREQAAAMLRSLAVDDRADDPEQAALLQVLIATLEITMLAPDRVTSAVTSMQDALDQLPADSHLRPALLGAVGNALGVWAAQNGDDAAMDRAVAMAEDAAELTVDEPLSVANAWSTVGGLLLMRFGFAPRWSDVDAAVVALRRSLDQPVGGDPFRATPLAYLSQALLLQHGFAPDPALPAEAVRLAEQALAISPAVGKGAIVLQLATALRARSETGDPADLRRARLLEREVVGISKYAGPAEQAQHAETVARASVGRFTHSGLISDLDDALATLGSLPDRPDASVGALVLAAISHRLRYERLGAAADITAATRLADRAIAAARHPRERAQALSLRGEVARASFQHTGDPADIAAAVTTLQEAEHILAERDAERSEIQGALSAAYLLRGEIHGDPQDVQRAVDVAEQAVGGPNVQATQRAMLRQILAQALVRRNLHFGDRADLDRAVGELQQAVDSLPVGDRVRISCLHNLGGALLNTYDRDNQPSTLDRAIEANRDALREIPDGHPDASVVRHGLAVLLQTRYQRTGQPADLAEIDEVTRGFALRRPDTLGTELRIRGEALLMRHETSGRRSDLKGGIAYLERSVRATSADHPLLADRLGALALAWLLRFDGSGRRRHRAAAIATARQATACTTAPVESRLKAHITAGAVHLSTGDAATAYAAFRTAVYDVLPQLAWRGLPLTSGQDRLRHTAGLAANAAAAALLAGDPAGAVEVLEQGRTQLWSQRLHTRTDRAQLREHHPDLCDRLDRIIAELTASAGDDQMFAVAGDPTRARYHTDVAHRWQLNEEFERLLADIRRRDRFDRFMRAPRYAVLRDAAAAGPVVIVNASAIRCDALIIERDRDTPRVIPLPTTEGDVQRHAESFARAVQRYATGRPADRIEATQDARRTLQWLWQTVAQPILRALPPQTAAGLPRLWWCPTSHFTLLPLHAAGDHEGGGDWLGAHRISSYTPTLQALLQHGPTPRGRAEGTLLVGVAQPPDIVGQQYGALPGVLEEIRTVAGLAPQPCTVLTDGSATVERTGAALRTHRYLHFACHGYQDDIDPSASYLALADGPLRVRDLAGQTIDHVEMAYLSACDTAGAAESHIDEALHLTAAFGYNGARHVVGSLWPIGDDSSARLAEHVYEHLATHGGDTATLAEGLRSAVESLREEYGPGNVLHWAPYVHFGT